MFEIQLRIRWSRNALLKHTRPTFVQKGQVSVSLAMRFGIILALLHRLFSVRPLSSLIASDSKNLERKEEVILLLYLHGQSPYAYKRKIWLLLFNLLLAVNVTIQSG